MWVTPGRMGWNLSILSQTTRRVAIFVTDSDNGMARTREDTLPTTATAGALTHIATTVNSNALWNVLNAALRQIYEPHTTSAPVPCIPKRFLSQARPANAGWRCTHRGRVPGPPRAVARHLCAAARARSPPRALSVDGRVTSTAPWGMAIRSRRRRRRPLGSPGVRRSSAACPAVARPAPR